MRVALGRSPSQTSPVRTPAFIFTHAHPRPYHRDLPSRGLRSPEKTLDLTYRLRSDFASTPDGAHQRIVVGLMLGADGIGFPVEGCVRPAEFSADVVREVWVW